MDELAPPRPLSQRAKANRDRIYAAAITLIRERGYDAVTMADIAKAAGVARASVFNHFPAKLAFLGEWFERFTRAVLQEASQQTGSSAWTRLCFVLEALARGGEANKDIIVHVASLAMGHGPLAATEAELDDELQLYFARIIRDGQASGEIDRDIDVDFLADLWVGLLTVTAHDWVNRGQVSDLSADLKSRFKTLFRGIEK